MFARSVAGWYRTGIPACPFPSQRASRIDRHECLSYWLDRLRPGGFDHSHLGHRGNSDSDLGNYRHLDLRWRNVNRGNRGYDDVRDHNLTISDTLSYRSTNLISDDSLIRNTSGSDYLTLS